MENVTLTEEQFERLLTVGRGPQLATPEMPSDDHRCQSLAIELLQLVNRSFWYGYKSGTNPKYEALSEQIRATAKEYL